MIDVPQEFEGLVNIIFLIVTAFIAYHGLTRNKTVKVIGYIYFWLYAAVYFFLVLFQDVFKVISF